ncbi:MAG: hypothetical protein KUG77_26120 [Nannocystaceae bacterium]|nr:hypothetical protein [Nannocystaceae bacterium]
MAARTLPVLLLLLASITPGCGRARDCTKLADIANRRGAEIAQIQARQSTTPDTLATDMETLSEVAAHVVEDLGTLELSDEALKEEAEAYTATAKDLSDASLSYSALMETLATERKQSGGVEAAFERSGQGLLDACAAASTACNAVGDVLREQPENPEPSKLAGLLGEYVTGLEALELREGPVSNAVAVRVATTKAYQAFLTRQHALDADIDAARSRIHSALDKQNTLIKHLNVLCVGKD